MRLQVFLLPFSLLLAPVGCGPRGERAGRTAAPVPATTLRLDDVTEVSGINFELGHGGRSPLTILETAGGGCAFTDLDRDGWPDVVLAGPRRAAIYRNRQDGSFEDRTGQCGLATDRYWMGCTVADYDGDGLPDLFLTGYRTHALYRNLGRFRFQDATASLGGVQLPWSLSAAFADLDGDADLDLFVSQYLKFDSTTPQVCRLGQIQSACGPEVYQPLSGQWLENTGRGFRARSDWRDTGKTWGVLVSQFDASPRPLIYLANDMLPGDLWVREGRTYRNAGPSSGTAYDAEGHLQGGMGVDSGDYDNDGRLDLFVTTFFAQPHSLYRNDGGGLFTVTSGPSGIGGPSMPYVGFGCAFSDLDNDGWLDLPIANGHVRDNVDQFDSLQSYRQPLQVFQGRAGGFAEVSKSIWPGGVPKMVGRGMSAADYDRDGRPDLMVVDLEGQTRLYRNLSQAGHWLRVRLDGRPPNRHGLGGLVTLHLGDRSWIREIKTCGSVLSALDAAAHFGIGEAVGAATLQVQWPSGRRSTHPVTMLDRELVVAEP